MNDSPITEMIVLGIAAQHHDRDREECLAQIQSIAAANRDAAAAAADLLADEQLLIALGVHLVPINEQPEPLETENE